MITHSGNQYLRPRRGSRRGASRLYSFAHFDAEAVTADNFGKELVIDSGNILPQRLETEDLGKREPHADKPKSIEQKMAEKAAKTIAKKIVGIMIGGTIGGIISGGPWGFAIGMFLLPTDIGTDPAYEDSSSSAFIERQKQLERQAMDAARQEQERQQKALQKKLAAERQAHAARARAELEKHERERHRREVERNGFDRHYDQARARRDAWDAGCRGC